MGWKDYRDLVVWQEAMDLVTMVYRFTAGFPKEETYGLMSQMRRAAVSVPSNIAEGQGRQTSHDFRNFLSIAHGSLKEVETQAYISQRLGFCDEERLSKIIDLANTVGRRIHALAKSLQRDI